MQRMYRVTRRYITLVEIMIVMTLIALILGVVAYNFQGALQEGNAFATRQRIEKIETIISLELARNPSSIDDVSEKWQTWVANSPLVKDKDSAVVDGWGNPFAVSVERESGKTKVQVRSERLNQFESE